MNHFIIEFRDHLTGRYMRKKYLHKMVLKLDKSLF